MDLRTNISAQGIKANLTESQTITMINKRVLVLAFELLSLLLVTRAGAHAVSYVVDVFDGTTPVVDGELTPGEWADASTLSFNYTNVHLKHDADNLYIAFNISDATPAPDAEGVYLGLDTSNDGGPSLNQTDDMMLGTFRNGTPFETDGLGLLPLSQGWNVSVFEEAAGYTIEFNVTYDRVGITSGENTTLGLLLLSFDTAFGFSIWPTMSMMDVTIPSNWGDMMVVFQTETIYIKSDGSIEGTDRIASTDNVTYTFTSDISAPIVVQRSNIVIEGEGWTLAGLNFALMEGFNLTAVTNVTIIDVTIERFASYSIYLESASQCAISRNTVVGSEGGIGLFSSTGNTVSDNEVTGCWEAVELVSSSGNVVSGNNITENHSGVYLVWSMGNTVAGNNLTANSNVGVLVSSSNSNIISGNNIAFSEGNINLWNSSNNTITGNTITHGAEAIQLWSSHNNTISDNNMTYNGRGVWIRSGSAENAILGNNIIDNTYAGIDVSGSHNNTISGNILVNNTDAISAAGASSNTITRNMIAENRQNGVAFDNAGYNQVCSNEIKTSALNGIFVEGDQSAFNVFYHNNIIDNTNPAEIQMSLYGYPPNTWDNGIEGNYWSNYTGADANHDGIGDSPHIFDTNNTDNAPLMGPFNGFNTSLGKPVNVISNSTVEGFEYESLGTIRFNVSNMTEDQTHGFCRVTIPHDVLPPPYNVTVNGASPTYMNYTLRDNGTHSWIYFEFEHSTVEVVIIPEFPAFTILPLLMTLVALATLVYRRKHI